MVVIADASPPFTDALVLHFLQHGLQALPTHLDGRLPLFGVYVLSDFPTACVPLDISEKPIDLLVSIPAALCFV